MGVKVGKEFVLEAADEHRPEMRLGSVTMKKDGTITIKGKDITMNGSGKINVKADGEVKMKGSKINNN